MPESLRQSGCARPPERARLREHLAQPATEAARFLLGQHLVRRLAGESPTVVRIVETEAYLGVGDPAAHAFRGLTERTRPLWGPPGTLYVYFIYGMHYCLNISVDVEGSAGCVLIRAAEPLTGELGALDCQGPGRLCRTLGIDTRMSGLSSFDRGSGLFLREGRPPTRIGVSPRIGIRKAADLPLRFFDEDSRAVSRGPRVR
jgi:DNA-3-methyladenine glycosylase